MSIHLLLDTAETVGEPRTGSRRAWTGREEVILRNVYPDGGIGACLEKLPGRSPSSIYQYANKLKLSGPKSHEPHAKPAETNEHIDALIRRTYQANPDRNAVKTLAQTIGRTRQWIRTRAIKLGIAVPRFKAADWTRAEIEIVTEAPHLNPVVLQRRLRKAGFERSEVAIVNQIHRAGVSTDDPDHYTANGLAKAFGVDIKVVTSWITKGWLHAKRRGTARVEEQGGDQWWINRRNIKKFVQTSVQVIDFRKLDKVWLVDLLAGPASLGGDEPRVRGGHRVGVFMLPKPVKCRLDQEMVDETQREIAHWLNDLNDEDGARVGIEILVQHKKTKLKSRSPNMDDAMEAAIRRHFLEAVRTGLTPEAAAEFAKEATCAGPAHEPIADGLAARMRAVERETPTCKFVAAG